jgi:hypothetical protein
MDLVMLLKESEKRSGQKQKYEFEQQEFHGSCIWRGS